MKGLRTSTLERLLWSEIITASLSNSHLFAAGDDLFSKGAREIGLYSIES
jgi:hypothetical protein